MDLYLLQNGERRGPFRIFQIKEMVDRGEAAPGDLGWHAGLAAWRPLREIDVLTPFLPAELQRALPPPLPAGTVAERDEATTATTSASSPVRYPIPWRRFFARLLDVWVMKSALGGICLAGGFLTPGEYLLPWLWLAVSFFVMWAVLEAFMLTHWGCTPGKWVFGLRVVRPDGSLLNFSEAVSRSFNAWFLGWAIGAFPFVLLTGILWMSFYRRHGRAWWDVRRGHELRMQPLRGGRLALAAGYLAAQVTFNFWLMWTYPLPPDAPAPLGGHSLHELIDEKLRRVQDELKHQENSNPR
jgi:uncharacterized RDD family membrane protein YckC